MYSQGRSHTFKSGGAQAAKIILGPFYLKNWMGPTQILIQSERKLGGAPLAHSKTTPLIVGRKPLSLRCLHLSPDCTRLMAGLAGQDIIIQ